MEMEKSYYVVTHKTEYAELIRDRSSRSDADLEGTAERSVVAITQGGFGRDVVDDERQVKERFLEHLFTAEGIDLTRSPEMFDRYFELEAAHDFIDLDTEE